MTRDARFWRNVTIVGLIHLGLLFGLLVVESHPVTRSEECRLDGRWRRGERAGKSGNASSSDAGSAAYRNTRRGDGRAHTRSGADGKK